MVLSLWDIAKALRTAAPDDKAEVYKELGIRVRYEPNSRVIIAQAGGSDACSTERVGGGSQTISTPEIRERVPLLRASGPAAEDLSRPVCQSARRGSPTTRPRPGAEQRGDRR